MAELTTLELGKLLKSFDDTIYYFPNQGNAGDSLIAWATFQFFDKYNIRYEIVSENNFDSLNKTVVYGGGGNFGGEDSRAAQFVLKNKNKASHLVILPHTIFDVEKLLASLGENCQLICREKVTYEFVKKATTKAKVHLHPDIVFQSDPSQLLVSKPKVKFSKYILQELSNKIQGKVDYDFGLSMSGYFKTIVYKLKKKLNMTPTGKVLIAFRVDCERTSDSVPKNNVDISSVLELGACQKDLAYLSAYNFLTEINAFEEIHTNRLHIAIGAALLGKQVKLYANNYYKIRAIYEYSFKDKFDNVKWMK